jgi:hypothetical protein
MTTSGIAITRGDDGLTLDEYVETVRMPPEAWRPYDVGISYRYADGKFEVRRYDVALDDLVRFSAETVADLMNYIQRQQRMRETALKAWAEGMKSL